MFEKLKALFTYSKTGRTNTAKTSFTLGTTIGFLMAIYAVFFDTSLLDTQSFDTVLATVISAPSIVYGIDKFKRSKDEQ